MNMNNEEKNTYVRKQILKSLLQMLKTKRIEDISVSDLVRKAGVGRASFYRNYVSVEAVLQQESDRLTAVWEEQFAADPSASSNALLISLLDFYKEHSRFYLALYKAGLSEIVMHTIVDTFPIDENTPNPAAYLQSSLAYMIYGWIHEWIRRGMQESGAELAYMIEQSQKRRQS